MHRSLTPRRQLTSIIDDISKEHLCSVYFFLILVKPVFYGKIVHRLMQKFVLTPFTA